MRNKYFSMLLVFVCAVSLVLYGCSEESSGNGTEPESSEEEAEETANEQVDENVGEESEGNVEVSSYPERDIEMVVGWGAGGGSDSFARAIAKEMEEILNVNINVVNMEGSSGAVAGDYVVNQPADGYTLWAISNYTVAHASGLNPHDLNSYIPIGRIQADTLSIQVAGNSQFTTIEELVEYAKENPGELAMGSTGVASFNELAARQFENAVGIEINYVPFESAGEMHAALLGGHVDALFEEIGPVIDYIEQDDIVPLVVWAEERIDEFPDIPTTVEKGWDLTIGVSRGLMVHGDTSSEIVKILEDALKEAKDKERYKEYERNSYLHLRDGWLDSEDYRQFLEKNIKTYKEILENME